MALVHPLCIWTNNVNVGWQRRWFRHSANNSLSELYYSWSDDGGLTRVPNRPLSPQFNHSLGYPQQNFMGWYPHPELNGNPRFRKPLLYPFELWGQPCRPA